MPVKPLAAVVVPVQGAVASIPVAPPAPKAVVAKPVVASPMPAAKIVAGAATRKPAITVTASAFGANAVPLQPGKAMPITPVPPVVVAKVTPPPKPAPEQWVIAASDATLRRALNKWAVKAGWQLVWEASVDVPINVTASFEGDFRTAVKRLFQSLSAADVNLNGMLYAGNRVLRVTESGRRAQ
ncbi:toxin co-regulated pilus biosynthesis Q family protein [Pseudomonas syringae]|nr:toxin co-regulated pilus biosynthesis Q family protein [Pseudomonas syringae]